MPNIPLSHKAILAVSWLSEAGVGDSLSGDGAEGGESHQQV